MSKTGTRQILSYLSDEIQNQTSDMFKRVIPGMEFEFIFFSKKGHQMNKEKYVLLLKYMRNMAKIKKLQVTIPDRTLDFGFTSRSSSTQSTDSETDESETENTVYRTTVSGTTNINRILNRLSDIQNKNYVIYKFLLHTLKKNNADKYLNFMVKSRGSADTVDIDDLNMRARLSKEEDLTDFVIDSTKIEENLDKLLTDTTLDIESRKAFNKKIFFRLKERTSLIIEEDDDHFIRIDLTDTKTTRDLRKINDVVSNYELEIEYGIKTKTKPKSSHLDTMFEISENLLKLIQQSSFIMSNSMSDKIIQYYKSISNIDTHISHIVARQPVSLEVQHVTEILPNKYAVSDKADGDRCFLIIFQNSVYLINSNLTVKDTGIVLDKKLATYNGTILDGEYIYLPKEKRHVYMCFDCLRSGSTDTKSILSFTKRLEYADKVIEDCFVFKGQTGFKFKALPTQDTFDVDAISQFYGKELSRFYEVLNKDVKIVKEYPLIRRKYFMSVLGAVRWEIFKYSVEFWSKYSEDSSTKFPYLLDGLIYHPLEQAYVTNVNESKYLEYKWKPPTKNSIDLYIEFKKDPQTGKILDVYDNSLSDDKLDGSGDTGTVRNKTYRICKLYVGKSVNGREMPVPFEQNYGDSNAYIYRKEGEIRDISGDIITDKTVVEFYYQNDPAIIPQQRWVPIKTRYDKTESVEKYGKRYGNYSTTADKIWRSIINPVLMDDFIELAKGNTNKRNFYDIKIKELNSKITHQSVVAANKENKYYQIVTELASTMRQFHNFIKSNLIYTYCNKMYQSNTQLSILDIGFGRGGDIGKYYYTEVAYLVGIDIDSMGFTSPVDGAISRYNNFRRKKPNFPKMYFIQADARALLDYDSQIKSLSGMEEINKKLLLKFFPSDSKTSLFDRINCQFAMHYFLKDTLSWSNFKQNLKNHLRSGGYFIATTFDAKEVLKVMKDQDTYTVYYDDSNGNKKKFFEIVKRYDVDGSSPIQPGSGIDVFMSWAFNEGNYQTEYLVDFDFIKKDLEDADLELVDSDLFSNQLTVHRKFLQEAVLFESSNETKEYMANVSRYYNNSDMNNKCMQYTNLHRYFVFRKRSPTDIEDVKNKKQKGGRNIQQYDFSDVKQFSIPSMTNYDDRYSFVNSVHKILVSHSIIPKSVKVDEFVSDLGMKLVRDQNITNDYINNLTKKTIINHEIVEDGKSVVKNLLNGLNIFLVERDCNNFYDISYSALDHNSGKAVILMKEGGLYQPIMRKDPKGVRGILKMKDEMIQALTENGESIE